MKIYHNAQCSKSNAALEFIQQNGISPEVVEFLLDIPTKDELKALLVMLNMKPLELIRTQEPLFQQNYINQTLTDEQWIDIMLQNPVLIERPIVVNDGKAIIARPLEKILEFLR